MLQTATILRQSCCLAGEAFCTPPFSISALLSACVSSEVATFLHRSLSFACTPPSHTRHFCLLDRSRRSRLEECPEQVKRAGHCDSGISSHSLQHCDWQIRLNHSRAEHFVNPACNGSCALRFEAGQINVWVPSCSASSEQACIRQANDTQMRFSTAVSSLPEP